MCNEEFLQNLQEELQEIKEMVLLGEKPVYTMEDAVKVVGVSKSNLYKLVHEKKIPHYKSKGGKLTYFNREELLQWLLAVRIPTNEELATQAATRGAIRATV